MKNGLIRTVASFVGISVSSARRVAGSAAHRYKVYKIPKRSGGLRVVAQPAREVKALQRALVHELQELLPLHKAATAYVTGSSIVKNAAAHRGARYLLKLDFASFFPSIGSEALRSHLLAYAPGVFSDSELQFILDLILWRDEEGREGLCIGAPSSPFFSNSVLFDFDNEVTVACDELGAIYTRYSDDLAFSTRAPEVLREVEARVREIIKGLEYPKLSLNETKRKAVSRAAGMYVTGLTLSNQGPVTVGRLRKRGVRAGVRRFLDGRMEEAEILRLRGELAFVLSVEPSFRQVLLNSYGVGALALMPRNGRG